MLHSVKRFCAVLRPVLNAAAYVSAAASLLQVRPPSLRAGMCRGTGACRLRPAAELSARRHVSFAPHFGAGVVVLRGAPTAPGSLAAFLLQEPARL